MRFRAQTLSAVAASALLATASAAIVLSGSSKTGAAESVGIDVREAVVQTLRDPGSELSTVLRQAGGGTREVFLSALVDDAAASQARGRIAAATAAFQETVESAVAALSADARLPAAESPTAVSSVVVQSVSRVATVAAQGAVPSPVPTLRAGDQPQLVAQAVRQDDRQTAQAESAGNAPAAGDPGNPGARGFGNAGGRPGGFVPPGLINNFNGSLTGLVNSGRQNSL